MGNKIWCLLSIDNEYNQPSNNLVCWWKQKPSIETIASTIEIPFKGEDNIIAIVGIYQGEEKRIEGTDYRLQEIEEGKRI